MEAGDTHTTDVKPGAAEVDETEVDAGEAWTQTRAKGELLERQKQKWAKGSVGEVYKLYIFIFIKDSNLRKRHSSLMLRLFHMEVWEICG